MRIRWGRYKGLHVEQLPLSYLKWMAVALKDGDYHEFAVRAEEILKSKEIRLEIINNNLDKLTDEFLDEH